MSAHTLDSPKTSSTRPKHQVTRSITEASTTSPKSHRPQQHHHHPHLHRKEHSRDKDPPNGQSTLQPHEAATKTEGGVTSEESRAGSTRTSVHGDMTWERVRNGDRAAGEKGVVHKGEVKEERERVLLRAAELRNAIMGLNTLSNNTTRRLDNTYYSVLEKLSILHSTIMSMKELAAMTRRLSEEFQSESEQVVNDIETQLDGLGAFEDQQKRILELKERVKTRREQIEALGRRVDVVRERIEGWEKAEGEWHEKTRKRLRILWMVIATCGVLLLGLMWFLYTPKDPVDVLMAKNASSRDQVLPELERIRNESLSWRKPTMGAFEEMLERGNEGKLEEDPRLRLFDEL